LIAWQRKFFRKPASNAVRQILLYIHVFEQPFKSINLGKSYL
jgi:hypothetical protein